MLKLLKSKNYEKITKICLLIISLIILLVSCFLLHDVSSHDFMKVRVIFGLFTFSFIILQGLVAENLLHTNWICSIIYACISAAVSGYGIYLGMSERFPSKYVKYVLKMSKHSKYIVLKSFPISEFKMAGWIMIIVLFMGLVLIMLNSHKSSKKSNSETDKCKDSGCSSCCK